MNNILEKISLTLILLKIFEIYLCCYFATNKKIAITHLWHVMEPKTICHLIVKDKVVEQYILGKYYNCNSFGVTMDLPNSKNFKVAICSAIKCATGFKIYYVIAYQNLNK